MNLLVPERLESRRLVLRHFKNPDWRDLHEYYSDAEATKFTIGRALTEGETWRTMCTMIGHWQIHGYGPYAIEEKASGHVLGTVGFCILEGAPGVRVDVAAAPGQEERP